MKKTRGGLGYMSGLTSYPVMWASFLFISLKQHKLLKIKSLMRLERTPIQVMIQSDLFIPDRWRSLSLLKGHLTIPKRSPAELPGR